MVKPEVMIFESAFGDVCWRIGAVIDGKLLVANLDYVNFNPYINYAGGAVEIFSDHLIEGNVVDYQDELTGIIGGCAVYRTGITHVCDYARMCGLVNHKRVIRLEMICEKR